MDRIKQLLTLKKELESLLLVLREDTGCVWTKHFEVCLTTTNLLIENGFCKEDLNGLSTQVRSVFGGTGSFNDYVPLEKFWGKDKLSDNVWEAAMDLKVVSK